MRAPKGFGKRYFALGAIQAYAGTVALRRRESSLHAHHRQVSEACEEDAVEEDEALVPEAPPPGLSGAGRRRPCHCSRLFHRRACKALRAHPRAKSSVTPYRDTYAILAPPNQVTHCSPNMPKSL